MSGRVRLVFGVHAHQPIGNFDDVVARALAEAYDPFLAVLERHPGVKAVLHYSGCLCEWLDEHAPGHLDRVASLAASGQIEILTGGFYEPILPLIPEIDRVGQIRMQTRYIKERFGVEARGMWLAERVWEPTLPRTLREAGVDYTLLDDYHFLGSMDGDPVGGYYITEDQGEPARLFPISERLRYLIPFREPAETIAWLRTLASTPGAPGAPAGQTPVAVIVDDGEKFGHWPGTHAWVHGEGGRAGWLESFLSALEENASWLETTTLASVAHETEPRGRVYLPPGSYFEMGEWSLPAGRGREFQSVADAARRRGAWDAERPFLRGGFFRSFQAKYRESLLMVRRAQMISRMMDTHAHAAADREGRPSEARRELWRAMCNCSYWHGIFGGLYLPHIRREVGRHLCRARRLFDAAGRPETPAMATTRFVDIDADGLEEVEIRTEDFSLLVEPARGGAITVLDLHEKDFPLALTLTRRVESYHEEMMRAHGEAGSAGHGSIHEVAVAATPELKRLVVADDRPRAIGVDRFINPGARVADMVKGLPEDRGDFYNGRYEAALLPPGEGAGVMMTRDGTAAHRAFRLIKTIRAGAQGRRLELTHQIEPGAVREGGLSTGTRFAVELNFALIESLGRLVFFDGETAGATQGLTETTETRAVSRLRVEDDYAGFALSLRIAPAATIWHYPIRTVSRSEKGYEAIYQGSALVLLWGDGETYPRETRIEIEIGYGK